VYAIGLSREPHRARQIADIVSPDVVSSLIMQAAHRAEGAFDDCAVLLRDGKALENGIE
jgi:hypothetical protein